MGPLGIYCDIQLSTFIRFLHMKTSVSLQLYLFLCLFGALFLLFLLSYLNMLLFV